MRGVDGRVRRTRAGAAAPCGLTERQPTINRALAVVAVLGLTADELCLRNRLQISFSLVRLPDEPAILEFLTHLSAESRDHHGLLARAAGLGVVGHAIYGRVPLSRRAAVAVEVADDVHHLGLATQLVIRLARFAEDRDVTRFFGEVLPENRDMLAVLRDAFATVSVDGSDGIEIGFATSGW